MKAMCAAAALVAGLGAAPLMAEPLDYYLVDGISYDQTVLKPAEVLGHDVGDQPMRHDLMVAYLREVAEKSPRMKVETIGYSHEGRPILFITVSSPENLAKLDQIRENHLLRSNPATADQASPDLPVITWLNYGVHGAEASGMEAVVPTVYHLAAAQGPEIEDTLKNSVLLITAIFNPDGHSRRVAWVTQYGSDVVTTDPNDEIHNEDWPGARTNHYLFDLNRQWMLQTQPESRAWMEQWHKWRPEVSADFHEMGPNSSYYFHPGVPTRKHPLIPARGRDLLVEIADYHRAFMDSEAKLYFSEEGFDNYYVGKGSTYPQVNGSLGILFEAGGQMGIARESDQGIKTMANNTRIHFRTSLSTIAGALAMREKLHAYQRDFYKEVPALVKDDDVKAYVFRAPEDPARTAMFIDLLTRNGVKSYRLSGSLKAGDGTYGDDSYIVPMDQPNYRMAKALFGRITEFPDKVFYDVSGWTLPLAYGMDYAAVTTSVKGRLGDMATADLTPPVQPVEAAYGYMFRWSDYYAPRALARILDAGIMARVIENPVRVQTSRGVVAFDRGAILVQFDHQTTSRADIHALMTRIADEDGLTIHAVTSGHTPDAGSDLGGRDSVADLKPVKPLLVTGPGVASYDAGEVWHLLDHKMKMPLTLVRKERLSRVQLSDYTHIILVGAYTAVVPKEMETPLKDWVKAGGTVVGMRQSALWAAKTLLADDKKDEGKKDGDKKEAAPERLPYSAKGQKDAEHVIGGAVFESTLDISHPLGFGYVRPMVATHRNTTLKLPVPKDPYARVAVYTDSPLLSGYASPRRIDEIKGSPMLTAERVGRGSVILFADDPVFRATYVGTDKLFLNALFFSTAFERAYGGGEAAATEE
ncbi:MAG: peptidase [Alphaproteobacteria bacterium]|nr:MAG: peptidase [Alphaproteobacteria bacterium]